MMTISLRHKKLETILEQVKAGHRIDESQLRFLLSLREPDILENLFAAAREIRHQFFGQKVFLYGFVYFNTFCRNDCRFCLYRKSNRDIPRYRKTREEVIASASLLARSGVHLIDLTMGELSELRDESITCQHPIFEMVRSVKEATELPIMVSPGVVSRKALEYFHAAGANWYACYQETFNRELFNRWRLDQDFDERLDAKLTARKFGMRIEEGILVGAGEQQADIASSIAAMRELSADQVRVMTFVPQAGTPMGKLPHTDPSVESLVLAVLRLVFPDHLIPASLDVDGLAGLKQRLNAGANVITSLIVPGQGLAGVANQELDIEQSRRTPDAVAPVLAECGLRVATPQEYRIWLDCRKIDSADPVSWPENAGLIP